jgi:hydroxyacylglutathione hydrolase
MKIQRFEVPGLVHYSYILSSKGRAVVVDPKRDVDTYVDFARVNGLEITHVLETHIHADYASGARELAAGTTAELWLSAHDAGEDFRYALPHTQFCDGQSLTVGEMRIEAVHTPGHTPEHISFLLHDTARASYPMALLSGDFVFVGSLGRPDLLGEEAKSRLANLLYDSVHTKIASLPDGVEVHPAHGAGSLCGSGMSERSQSTLGYERHANAYFALTQRREFVERILSTVPPFPDYYRRMKRINSDGPALLEGVPGGDMLSPAEFRKRAEDPRAVVIDLRRPEAFGGSHIPGALNIGAGPSFAFWAGWIVPYDRPIFLVPDDEHDAEETRRALIRVGLDSIHGCLRGGMRSWIEAGYEQAHLPQISVLELRDRLRGPAFVVDVRTVSEWQAGHIDGARHLMAGDVPKRLDDLPHDQPIHIICGTGYRSSIVSSLLRREGFVDVLNVSGGMTAWNQAGLPVVREAAVCAA